MSKRFLTITGAQLERIFRDYGGEVIDSAGVKWDFELDEDADDQYECDGKYHWIYPEFIAEDGSRWTTTFQGVGYPGDVDWASVDGMHEL